ncbi:TATA box-binding protein-associated factor RNA polymerase I subunit B [Onthophagus taurus]|uniref:TATA box-binding protein-associated factor RNA polymerase I subunit B n=1 Tax=Onthophagus taurus TaxID=166361 RepID=UPI0039BEB069
MVKKIMPVTCTLCEGTDFYKEAGFYFCSECQTQTQDIQEHVFEDQVDEAEQPPQHAPKRKPKRTSSNKANDEERLTSWECYNYILLGLVNELIELGADKSLRTTVEVLWLHYLKKIEVIREGNLPPKLPAVNSDRDASIIYGRSKAIKRRRSRSKSVDSSIRNASTLDNESIKRERTRQKKALAKTEYDEYLSTTQQSESSLVNQSLSSLKSANSSPSDAKVIQYNKTAEKCLKKHMKARHLKKHCEDVHSTLDCHKKLTGRSATSYYNDPSVISRSKLFSLLYLGLLMNKQKIQLGDMLRFIKEGHLSFQHVDKFFPEELVEKKLNISSFTKGPSFITHSMMRSNTVKLISYLNIKNVVPVQNIVEMCERYCKELNLPDFIYSFVLNIISRSLPKFQYTFTSSLPNYEGRAVGFIIFLLKILFGLDDSTEYEMSKLASTINLHLRSNHRKMFNFHEWLLYIKYRHFIVCQNNFPASYNENWHDETKIFVKHLEKYAEKHELVKEDAPDIEIFKRLLYKLDQVWEDFDDGVDYKPTLTPYRDYINALLKNERNDCNYNEDILRLDCSNMSLEYIFYDELYLNNIFPNVKIIRNSGGKNNDMQLIYLFDTYKRYRANCSERRNLYNVTLLSEQNPVKFKNFFITSNADSDIKPNSKQILENYDHTIVSKVKKNFKRRQKLFQNVDENLVIAEKSDVNCKEYVLYEPSERVCVNLQNVTLYTEEDWEKFYQKFSLSFRTILAECARITEQTTKDVYLEYAKIEIYLSHVLDVGNDRFYDEKIVNNELKKNIEHTKKSW